MTHLALFLVGVMERLNQAALYVLALVTRLRWWLHKWERADTWEDLDRYGKWRGDA